MIKTASKFIAELIINMCDLRVVHVRHAVLHEEFNKKNTAKWSKKCETVM